MSIKIKEELKEWTINFLKNKNAILQTLQKIEEEKEGYDLKIIYDDKETYVLIKPFIDNFEELEEKIDQNKNITLVLLNSKKNLDILIDKWEYFAGFDKLTIYFVNMFSISDKKWVIRPYLHNKISEASALKPGLKSMFNTVDSITEKEAESKTL
jgi:hypothetical protein